MLTAYVRFDYGHPVPDPNRPGKTTDAFQFSIGPLELVELLARRKGFDDVDVEPMDNYVRITCGVADGSRKVSAKGSDVSEACEKLLEIIK